MTTGHGEDGRPPICHAFKHHAPAGPLKRRGREERDGIGEGYAKTRVPPGRRNRGAIARLGAEPYVSLRALLGRGSAANPGDVARRLLHLPKGR